MNNYHADSAALATACVYIPKNLISFASVDGVTVSIGAFQALVPGSTPGRRIFASFFFVKQTQIYDYKIENKVKLLVIVNQSSARFLVCYIIMFTKNYITLFFQFFLRCKI